MSNPAGLWLIGSQAIQTLVTGANLNGLANNAAVVGTAYNNTVNSPADATGKGMILADLELYIDGFGSAVTANTAFSLWFLMSQDGTNYEDGSSSVIPAKLPNQTFPLRAVSTAQKINRRVFVPWGLWKPLLYNNGTGQSVNANNNSYLNMRIVTTNYPSI